MIIQWKWEIDFKNFIFWPHHGACGILVSQPWIEPSSLAVEAQSLNRWTTGAFPFCYLKIKKFIYLHFGCAGSLLLYQLFSGCSEPGLFFSCSALASHCDSSSVQALGHTGFSCCYVWAQQLWFPSSRAQAQQLWYRSTWNLPRPGIEPMSPALAGRFFTTEPPGKPLFFGLLLFLNELLIHLKLHQMGIY